MVVAVVAVVVVAMVVVVIMVRDATPQSLKSHTGRDYTTELCIKFMREDFSSRFFWRAGMPISNRPRRLYCIWLQ